MQDLLNEIQMDSAEGKSCCEKATRRKYKIRKTIAAAVLSAFTLTCVMPMAAFATNEDEIADLQEEWREIQAEQVQLQAQLDSQKKEQNKLTAQLRQINANLHNAQAAVNNLDAEISNIEGQIAFTEMEIENKQRDYDGRLALFNRRLKEMYQYGDMNYISVLLQSSSLSDFLTRFEYLKYIANNDQKLLEEVQALQKQLDEQHTSLTTMKTDLEAKKQTQVTKAQELETASAEQQRVVNAIKADVNATWAMLEETEAESKELEGKIQQMLAANGDSPATAPGAYIWPCPSSKKITSPYGYRIHPIQGYRKLHTGMDIGAKKGADILAAAGGKVIMAQYYGGYGNCIIIDHGGGMTTLYAHMSAYVAKNGDWVSAGQVIGKVGSTGNSTGPHLHFEVRINGKTTDPAAYVKAK
ncbi:MAG: peptidoglycan DD-metalloendopeptidase family protein [Peptococcaceae bacterium]|nr:peptidoglycan DD-metalloendopeptidase family protein [Peptococcaceae bacterium]